MAHVTSLLTLGRPHTGLLRACLAASHRPADRPRSRRAASLLGALLLFSGALLCARSLYLRGEPGLAALVIRKAHEETLGVERARAGRHDAQAPPAGLAAGPESASICGRSQPAEPPCLPTRTCP